MSLMSVSTKKSRIKTNIGFIGQGFVGKSYADDFEKRGFSVVRYAEGPAFISNKKRLLSCSVVFVAVPTPTTSKGFDLSIVEAVMPFTGKGATVVIKSTLLPGTTKELQKKFPDRYVMHSPEFLSEATAIHDAAHPLRNIVGIPKNEASFKRKAKDVLSLLPKAPFELICDSTEAELIKYARNIIGYGRVILMNILFDYAQALSVSWDPIRSAIGADPDNGPTYTNPVHKSGRGAGGRCFIKDMAAFRVGYEKQFGKDKEGVMLLRALERKNIELLVDSNKDIDLLKGVYGKKVTHRHTKSR